MTPVAPKSYTPRNRPLEQVDSRITGLLEATSSAQLFPNILRAKNAEREQLIAKYRLVINAVAKIQKYLISKAPRDAAEASKAIEDWLRVPQLLQNKEAHQVRVKLMAIFEGAPRNVGIDGGVKRMLAALKEDYSSRPSFSTSTPPPVPLAATGTKSPELGTRTPYVPVVFATSNSGPYSIKAEGKAPAKSPTDNEETLSRELQSLVQRSLPRALQAAALKFSLHFTFTLQFSNLTGEVQNVTFQIKKLTGDPLNEKDLVILFNNLANSFRTTLKFTPKKEGNETPKDYLRFIQHQAAIQKLP